MLTRKQLNIELEKARNQIAELETCCMNQRKEILVYNRLQSLNEAHLLLALAKLGVTESEPLRLTVEQIRDAVEEMRVQVNRDGDNVSLWYEVI